jgi:DNA-binding transcriptional MerR regulator
MEKHRTLWTLDELGAVVALALAVDYTGTANGRVRDVPDARTIRYYTTLGLIDRPEQMRGRTALYGLRHLLQLVAIKRLQARGLTLAEVQQQLLGKSDAALRKLARLPAATGTKAEQQGPNHHDRSAAEARNDFWKEAPGTVSRPEPVAEQKGPRSLTGVPLAEGTTLLIEAVRSLDASDLSGLRTAAAPLLRFLRARRIIGADSTPPDPKGPTP